MSSVDQREDYCRRSRTERTITPGDTDVTFGNKHSSKYSPGTCYLRSIAQEFCVEYNTAVMTRKHEINKELVDRIQSRGGRFLDYNQATSQWFEVEHQRARMKVAQIMRHETKRHTNSDHIMTNVVPRVEGTIQSDSESYASRGSGAVSYVEANEEKVWGMGESDELSQGAHESASDERMILSELSKNFEGMKISGVGSSHEPPRSEEEDSSKMKNALRGEIEAALFEDGNISIEINDASTGIANDDIAINSLMTKPTTSRDIDISIVCSTMIESAGDAKVQVNGLGAMSELLFWEGPNREEVNSQECVKVILAAMRNHPADSKVQSYGCQSLAYLAHDNEEHQLLLGHRAIDDIFAALTEHEQDDSVQHFGCMVLGELCHQQPNQLPIVEAKGIEVVVGAIERHPDKDLLHRNALAVLGNLADHGVCFRDRIMKYFGVEKILGVIQRWPSNMCVQRNGMKALMNLLAEHVVPELTGERLCEIVVCAMAAMKSHTEHKDHALHEYSCKVIGQLSTHTGMLFELMSIQDRQAAIRKVTPSCMGISDIIDQIVRSMRQYRIKVGVQVNGIIALRKLVCGDKQGGKDHVWVLTEIVDAMKQYPASESVQENGCSAIEEFCDKLFSGLQVSASILDAATVAVATALDIFQGFGYHQHVARAVICLREIKQKMLLRQS